MRPTAVRAVLASLYLSLPLPLPPDYLTDAFYLPTSWLEDSKKSQQKVSQIFKKNSHQINKIVCCPQRMDSQRPDKCIYMAGTDRNIRYLGKGIC